MKADLIVRGLREKLKEVDAQYEKLRKERDHLYGAIAVFERDIRESGDPNGQAELATYTDTLRDAICNVLTEEQPLLRRDILDRVKDRGIPITAKNPIRLIGHHLSVDPRFKNVARGTWALETWEPFITEEQLPIQEDEEPNE